jgi:hypothetical protein
MSVRAMDGTQVKFKCGYFARIVGTSTGRRAARPAALLFHEEVRHDRALHHD